MNLKRCAVNNFGSYKYLEFSYDSQGLMLVYGSTGSGKSTLQDIAPWVLFGITAKGGSVDEVRNWTSNDPTRGTLDLELDGDYISVTRVRGNSSQNDLYWMSNGIVYRGKDINDTQKLLNQRLGVNSELYCTATYFNEFSETGNFFTAKAKDRRLVFEKIASLDLPVLLADKSLTSRKKEKKNIEQVKQERTKAEGKLEQLLASKEQASNHFKRYELNLTKTIAELENKSKTFQEEKNNKIEELSNKSYKFEAEKAKKLEELVDRLDTVDQKIRRGYDFDSRINDEKRKMLITNPACPTCKRPVKATARLEQLEKEKAENVNNLEKFAEITNKINELQKIKNPYKEQIEQAKAAENHYLEQLEEQKRQINPFVMQLEEIRKNVESCKTQIAEFTSKLSILEYKFNALTHLYDLSFVLRSALLKKVVNEIQDNVNNALTYYFDSEFRVAFTLKDGDDLSVEIFKNGNNCVFTQLSKGQRQLLKLCFCVSVMKAASNNSGIHFNVLSFDEALDGLDSSLKIKAFNLFSELAKEHETILLIDHNPEFQNLFDHKCEVTLENDESVLHYES